MTPAALQTRAASLDPGAPGWPARHHAEERTHLPRGGECLVQEGRGRGTLLSQRGSRTCYKRGGAAGPAHAGAFVNIGVGGRTATRAARALSSARNQTSQSVSPSGRRGGRETRRLGWVWTETGVAPPERTQGVAKWTPRAGGARLTWSEGRVCGSAMGAFGSDLRRGASTPSARRAQRKGEG